MQSSPPDAATDAATRAALQSLADIAVPQPVSYAPQTWGWAVVAVVALAFVSWGLVRALRARTANRYRRQALTELDLIEEAFADEASRHGALLQIPALLKRTALSAWPRTDVAALSGEPWIEFLRARGASVDGTLERLLTELEYRPSTLDDITAKEARRCAERAREWIRMHRVEKR